PCLSCLPSHFKILPTYDAYGTENRMIKDSLHRLRKCADRRLRLETLEERHVLSATVLISEFMASNSSTLLDGDGESSDWIEIYNGTSSPVDLAGWHLTDDEDDLLKWQFPSMPQTILDPGEYLIVFASAQLTSNYIDAG